MSLQKIFSDAVDHHRAGRLAAAEEHCRRILAADSRHDGALHLLGLIAYQVGRNDIAVELIGTAIGINGAEAAYYSNLGIALKGLGRFDDAAAAYNAAIRLQPDLADAYSNLGNTLSELGRFDSSAAACIAAICLKPDFAGAYSNLGNVLKELERFSAAGTACTAAIRLRPDFADAHFNLGNALKEMGRPEDSVAAYRAALCLKPDHIKAHFNLGSVLREVERLDAAAAASTTAIRLKPDYAEAHSNLGNVLSNQGRLDDAISAYTTAIQLKPDFAEAHANLANALMDLGHPEAATAACNTAIRLKPDYIKAYNSLLMSLHYQEKMDDATIFAEAKKFAAQFEKNTTPPVFNNTVSPERRVRIGYVSGDFRRHPVGYFLMRVLSSHNLNAFEVFCYSTYGQEDDLTRLLRQSSNHWRSLVGLSDEAAAEAVAADGIDILIDLAGHTAHNRLTLFARKPAPIQVTWLGYFGTTGLAAMDYVLADSFVAPDHAAPDFTESIWRLPDSYLCFSAPDVECPVLPPPAARGEPITFGNFNNNAKTSPTIIALMARILKRIPNSRLLLKTRSLGDTRARRRLLNQFAESGIGADRLLLEGASPRAELLSAYNRVDVALDPTPYGGGTTTAEALWMGVPVVTLRGKTWVGRVSESILSVTGLPELVAATADEYVDLAVGLAGDMDRLISLRSALRAKIENSAFFDGGRFTGNLERAYRGMWHRWCAKQIEGNG